MSSIAEVLAQAQELLYLEAHHLDQKQWTEWVEMYTQDAKLDQ